MVKRKDEVVAELKQPVEKKTALLCEKCKEYCNYIQKRYVCPMCTSSYMVVQV